MTGRTTAVVDPPWVDSMPVRHSGAATGCVVARSRRFGNRDNFVSISVRGRCGGA